jgi:hypothetical protein
VSQSYNSAGNNLLAHWQVVVAVILLVILKEADRLRSLLQPGDDLQYRPLLDGRQALSYCSAHDV